MKSISPSVLACAAFFLLADGAGLAAPVKKDEIDYQNYAFKQWYGTTLVWRYERLPKQGSIAKHRMPYAGAIYLDRQGGTVNALSKYDDAFHGGESKATQFEWRDIALRGTTSWAGHCNGWTAAAIRHAEPRKSVTRNGVTFAPSDIKELLAELYVYADTEFLGGIDTAINPATLHVVLTNWIGRGKHPIGVETTLGREVWNYPAYSFTTESNFYDERHVEVRLNLACVDFVQYEYDEAPKNKQHPLYFHYVLTLNEDGEIVDGTYLYDSNQIDMLWVPMKPTRGGTEGNEEGNPHIDPDVIVGMWRESVPESVRTEWYVVDPLPEDAVLVSDWFQVSPTADDARLEYIPDLTREQAESLELAARQPAETSTTEPSEPAEVDNETSSVASAPAKNETASGGDVASKDADRAVEVFRERFPSGALKVEREVTLDEDFNYVSHGIYRLWSEQGLLLAEGRLDMGQRVGQWKRAYATDESELFSHRPFDLFQGPFISTATFRAGRLHGTWTIHDSQDRKASEIEFFDGARHGKLLFFYPDGTKMREIDFRNGLVDGFLREFDKKGEVTLEHKYLDGHYCSTKVESFISTTKKSTTDLMHPRMVINSPDDWWNASMAGYGMQEGEPVRHGVQTVWYENGQLRFRGQFDRGEATGEFVWWQENGQVSRKGQYLDGKQHGRWSWWHKDGSRSVLGSYDRGTPVGRWLLWKPGGELDHIKDLADGQPVAETERIDEKSLTEPRFPEPVPEKTEPVEVEAGPRAPALPQGPNSA